jgi:hypothetical protein
MGYNLAKEGTMDADTLIVLAILFGILIAIMAFAVYIADRKGLRKMWEKATPEEREILARRRGKSVLEMKHHLYGASYNPEIEERKREAAEALAVMALLGGLNKRK